MAKIDTPLMESVIVAGAGGELGQVVVKHLLSVGMRVYALYHHKATVAQTSNLITWHGDLSDGKAVSKLLADITADDHPALVSTVGGFVWNKTDDFADKDFYFLLNANFVSSYLLLKNIIPPMRKHNEGRIVFISSMSSLQAGEAGTGVYTATKSALNALIKCTATENFSHNIRINTICPTIIDTPRNRQEMPDADFSTWIPCQRIAELIHLLLTDNSKHLTGCLLPLQA